MNCPKCKSRAYVMDVVNNHVNQEAYRKKRCKKCGHVFFTVEFEVENDKVFMRKWFLNHRERSRKRGVKK